MRVAIDNNVLEFGIGASVFAPVSPEHLYEALRDVRGFPGWASGVRRVQVLEGEGRPGMVSEWEISALGFSKKVLSVLEAAESPGFLRWSYAGPVRGWGECVLAGRGEGTLAEFVTGFRISEPLVAALARRLPVREVVSRQLRRSLAELGRIVSGGNEGVRVGPLLEAGRALKIS